MMRLTIAHYYTPSGRCIQKPYKKGDMLDYEMDLDNRYKHGELYSADSIHFADSLKYFTLRQHKIVYGGGGIMPDYFVPLDTMQYTRLHRQLAAKSIILNANLKYVDNNRNMLKKKYPTFTEFREKFEVPQSLIDSILKEGEKQKIKPKDAAELKQTLPYLKTQLKALVARDIWDMSEYFSIMNETNDIVQKAVELMKQN
jgi:carboxyl-terminal processing protease